MPNDYNYVARLIAGYLREELNADEQAEINAWLSQRVENKCFLERLEDASHLQKKLTVFHEADRDRLWELTRAKLDKEMPSKSRSVRPFIKWLPYAAALLVGAMVITWLFIIPQPREEAKQAHQQMVDLLPGGNRATLTLTDGRAIKLDERRQGIVIGSEDVSYSDGSRLASIADDQTMRSNVGYFELRTPKGGTYQVTLPDGTRVWLNAASKLKYPSRFDTKERVVLLEGEAYFEVSKAVGKSSNIPFKVRSGGQVVEVLGTQFNVSAYAEGEGQKTTLAEGRIRVTPETDRSASVILRPGEQAIQTGATIRVSPVNVEQYIAWKNGLFFFNNTPFDEAIQQIARWYDVEVHYEGKVPQETFSGRMQRDLTLGTMLTLLNISDAEFRLEGHTLVVK